MHPRLALPVLLCAALVGCSDSRPASLTPSLAPSEGQTTPAAAPPTLPSDPQAQADCPPRPQGSWGGEVPADFPTLPELKVGTVQRGAGGITARSFTAHGSIRESLIVLVPALNASGYTIGRGDAEVIEADVPFSRDGIRGALRLQQAGPCQLQGVLALAQRGGGPPVLLSPAPSSSPLPFG